MLAQQEYGLPGPTRRIARHQCFDDAKLRLRKPVQTHASAIRVEPETPGLSGDVEDDGMGTARARSAQVTTDEPRAQLADQPIESDRVQFSGG
jgi:hypothetical protein